MPGLRARRRLVLPATATAAAADARPDRPRAVLDRPPAGARRAHRAHARRRLPRRPPGPPGRPRRRAAVVGRAADDRLAASRPSTPASRDEVLRLLTLDPEHPTSILNCVTRAREGARTRARRLLRRDVGGDQHVPPRAAAAQHLGRGADRARTRVYAYVRERCGLFWGVTARTMLRDEAHAFLQAGAAIESADMVLRMLRVALPARGRRRGGARRPGARAPAGRRRLPGLPALRPRAAQRRPVARFLLYEREYPDSVAFSIEALHDALTAADPSYRSSPAGAAALAADGRPRLPRAHRRAPSPATLGAVQTELGAGRRRHRPALLRRPGAARRAPAAA